MSEVRAVRERLKEFSDKVRDGIWIGVIGKLIRHIVNIGIGGSHLGPMMVAEVLKDFWREGMTLAFVSNFDRVQLEDAFVGLDLGVTLFVIVFKIFIIVEIMANAHVVREWLVTVLGDVVVVKHFAVVFINVVVVV